VGLGDLGDAGVHFGASMHPERLCSAKEAGPDTVCLAFCLY
jgi:hypothetical protein